MSSGHGAEFVYRQFLDITSHLYERSDKKFRVTSGLFKDGKNELSLDDGAFCTPEETAGRKEGCGVVAIPKSTITELGLEIEPDPLDENSAHCVIRGKIPETMLRKLVKAAIPVVQLPSRSKEVVRDS